MGCLTDFLANDIVNNCDHLAVSGIEEDVILIPFRHFDKGNSVVDATNRMLITDLVLTSGNAGNKLEGVKQLNRFNDEFVPNEDGVDRWRHTFEGRIMTPSTENRLAASKLTKGESYVIVIHRKYKGVNNADAFLVLGWDSGLYVTTMTESSVDNDGAFVFTMASKDNSLEYDMPRNLLETDYDTTLVAFNAKFAQA